MSDKTLKDLTVDAHIAVLHTKVDALIEKQKELTERVRANEKVVAALGLLGTIAIAFISATYSSEVLRAAYLAVNKGQIEAAKALGLNKFQIFFKVMGPQILRHALPGIGNVWQITLKDTSLISVTGLVEIMRQSRIASNV